MYLPTIDVAVSGIGDNGFDTYMTVEQGSVRPGLGQVQAHQGSHLPMIGTGRSGKRGDRFILGDARTAYYAGKDTPAAPDDDFVYITGFDPAHSEIRLHGGPSDYELIPVGLLWERTAIFLKHNKDLLAIIDVRTRHLALGGPRFDYARTPPTTPAVAGLAQIGGPGTDAFGALGSDPAGNTFAAFGCGPDVPGATGTGSNCLAMIDVDGTWRWIRRFGTDAATIGRGEQVTSIQVIGDRIFVVGHTQWHYGGPAPTFSVLGSPVQMAAFVAQFDRNGNELAVRQLFPTSPESLAFGACADDRGGLYVVGATTANRPAGFTEADLPIWYPLGSSFIAKIDTATMTISWLSVLRAQPNPLAAADEAIGGCGFAGDATRPPGAGHVWVSGFTTFGSFPGCPLLADGTWVAALDEAGRVTTTPRCIAAVDEATDPWASAVDRDGNYYVVGQTNGAFPNQRQVGRGDAFVAKIGRDGSTVWTRQLGSADEDSAHGVSVVGDAVFVTGNTSGSLAGPNAGGDDIWIAKLSTDGAVLAQRQIGTSGFDGYFLGGVLDAHGDAVDLLGATEGSLIGSASGGTDAFIARVRQDDLSPTR